MFPEIKAIITGSTGMVGEGVLLECLKHPAFMKAVKGQKNLPKFYKYIQLPYPVLHALFPQYFGTLSDVGIAMINCVLTGAEKKVPEARDIAKKSKRTV